jgi:LemA protein
MGWVVFGVIVALLLFLVLLYNRLVLFRNRVDQAWSGIDVQLKRRYDLIPNLVETVKGYAAHEQATFERVTQARSAAMAASSPEEQAAAEQQLSQALLGIRAVAEAYPQLQADQNFRQLMDELANTENKISFARQLYNDTVKKYQVAIQQFPGVLVAGPMGFKPRQYFDDIAPTERAAPQVSFTEDPGGAPPPAG